jgi:hypothetical protein
MIFAFIKMIFNKIRQNNKIRIKQNNKSYYINATDLILDSHGIYIGNSFIPYENIIKYYYTSDGFIVLNVLAKYTSKIEPGDSFLKIYIKSKKNYLINTITDNIYFHLTHHKFNRSVLFYKTIINNKK